MPERLTALLNALVASEAGRRLAINLENAIAENHVSSILIRKLLEDIFNRIGTLAITWRRFVSELTDIIYEDPDDYQFLGPQTGETADDWITVKTLSEIVGLILSTGELSELEIQGSFGLATAKAPNTGITPAAAEAIAQFINDPANDIRFPLAKSFPHPKTGAPRPAPAWFSRWDLLPAQCKMPGSGSARAGAFRDWLGLGHFKRNHPLYVIRSRLPIDAAALDGRRPTVLDGFDNKLYKHRCSEAFQRRVSGSTLDIVKARDAAGLPPIADLEGGPEIISTALYFTAGDFECEYLGKTPALGLNQDCPYLHRHMLPEAATLTDVVACLTRWFYGASAAGSARV